MMWQLLLVGLGGGLGAMCRHLLSSYLQRPGGFPFGTLFVNVLGCFLIGLAVHLLGRHRLLVVTGFLGGFTTYSAFGYESLHLLKSNPSQAVFYLGIHLAGGLLAVWIGLTVVQFFHAE